MDKFSSNNKVPLNRKLDSMHIEIPGVTTGSIGIKYTMVNSRGGKMETEKFNPGFLFLIIVWILQMKTTTKNGPKKN